MFLQATLAQLKYYIQTDLRYTLFCHESTKFQMMSICGCLLLTLTPVLNMYFKNTFHIVKVKGEEAGKTELLKLHRRITKIMYKEFVSMLILAGFESVFFWYVLVC